MVRQTKGSSQMSFRDGKRDKKEVKNMETIYTNEEMSKMHADYIREKIVRGIQGLSLSSTRTLEVTSIDGDVNLIDVSMLENHELRVTSFIRSGDRDVTARVSAELEDVEVFVGYDVSIRFVDSFKYASIILYPDRIRNIYWGDVIY